MSLSGKVSTELGIKSRGDKFFNLFSKELQHVQNLVDIIHEAKVHHGDWHGYASVKQWTYTLDGKVTTCKENIEVIDPQNKTLTFNLFEGDVGTQFKVLKAHLQVIDKVDGSAVAKWTYEYEKVNEDVPPPHRYLDFVTAVTKDVDAHLITKP